MARPPYLAMPYPLDEYLDQLDRDYERIAKRLLRAANWERGPSPCGRYELDAGEALIDERSQKLWGSLRLDRNVSETGRRALVRRVLERLERDGIVSRRPAQAFGARNGPRLGPSPTVVRFLKFREILWPASVKTAQDSAQDSAQQSGPILPASPPAPPAPPASQPRARARDGGGGLADTRLLELRTQLGLGLRLDGPLGIGTTRSMDEDAVVAFFEAEITDAGFEEDVAKECCDLAQKSTTGTPTTLAWFIGWLQKLPRRRPALAAGVAA
jgi:hypothetical protein